MFWLLQITNPVQGQYLLDWILVLRLVSLFLINAPLFLNEWIGDVLLEKDDDAAFKNCFPGIRNIVVHGKNNIRETKALALYVWNRQSLISTMAELIPLILTEIRDPIQHSYSKNARLLYRYWPYHSRIRPRFKELIGRTVYDKLASSSMALYLTEKDGFKTINQGCFASPDFPLNETATFFLQHMSLFTIPKLVVEDLTHFGINMNQLTPSGARNFLKGDRHTQYLTGHPKDALAMLEYCLADLRNETSFDTGSKAACVCKNELMGLRLLPLSDGTVGSFGKEIIVATTEQQVFLPHLRNKFLSPFATNKLHHFLSNPEFLCACHLSQFGPKVLSKHISAVLPTSWERKDFVSWTPDNGDFSEPSKLWIHQFWREVSIWDHDQLSLFRRWPLIPTTTGELASCGNARFILSICPNLNDSNLRQSLIETYTSVKSALQTKGHLNAGADETLPPQTSDICDSEKYFWGMGEPDEVTLTQQEADIEIESSSSNQEDLSCSSVTEEEDLSLNNGRELPEPEAGPAILHSGANGDTEAQSLGYDPNSATFLELRRILMNMNCPLLEASFYSQEELKKLLPSDRLGVSRAIMSTLRQCIDYWNFDTVTSEGHHRLRWSELTSDDYDYVILFLSVHQESRLSLMVSDLEAMKKLPLFETFSGYRITISERGDNFTIDSSVDIDSVGSYLPQSLQQKLLLEKPQLKELYEDLHIECLNEATILQKFVLKEFYNMPLAQKEAVIQVCFISDRMVYPILILIYAYETCCTFFSL